MEPFGLNGAGVRVGCIDTGVNAGHTDLAGKVVGWRDFVTASPRPTTTTATAPTRWGRMVGGSAGGNPIGVAPGASVVVARP